MTGAAAFDGGETRGELFVTRGTEGLSTPTGSVDVIKVNPNPPAEITELGFDLVLKVDDINKAIRRALASTPTRYKPAAHRGHLQGWQIPG